MDRNLTPPNIVSHTIKRITSKPLVAFAMVLAFNLVTNIPLALYFEAWFPNNRNFGYSREFGWWVVDFVVQPLLLAYLVWVETASQNLLQTLVSEKRFGSTDGLEELIAHGTKRAKSPWVNRIAFLIALVVQAAVSIGFLLFPNQTWYTADPIIFAFRSAVGVFAYYILVLIIFTLLNLFITINHTIGRLGVRVEPFHPDNAGGLGSIGSFLSNFGYAFFVIGIGLTLSFYQSQLYLDQSDSLTFWLNITIFFSILIAVVVPSIFFLPLYSTHVEMKKYRDSVLAKISQECSHVYCDLEAAIEGNPVRLEHLAIKLKQLHYIRERVTNFPVWPHNFGNLSKFFGLSIAPFIPTIISQLVVLVFTGEN